MTLLMKSKVFGMCMFSYFDFRYGIQCENKARSPQLCSGLALISAFRVMPQTGLI